MADDDGKKRKMLVMYDDDDDEDEELGEELGELSPRPSIQSTSVLLATTTRRHNESRGVQLTSTSNTTTPSSVSSTSANVSRFPAIVPIPLPTLSTSPSCTTQPASSSAVAASNLEDEWDSFEKLISSSALASSSAGGNSDVSSSRSGDGERHVAVENVGNASVADSSSATVQRVEGVSTSHSSSSVSNERRDSSNAGACDVFQEEIPMADSSEVVEEDDDEWEVEVNAYGTAVGRKRKVKPSVSDAAESSVRTGRAAGDAQPVVEDKTREAASCSDVHSTQTNETKQSGSSRKSKSIVRVASNSDMEISSEEGENDNGAASIVKRNERKVASVDKKGVSERRCVRGEASHAAVTTSALVVSDDDSSENSSSSDSDHSSDSDTHHGRGSKKKRLESDDDESEVSKNSVEDEHSSDEDYSDSDRKVQRGKKASRRDSGSSSKSHESPGRRDSPSKPAGTALPRRRYTEGAQESSDLELKTVCTAAGKEENKRMTSDKQLGTSGSAKVSAIPSDLSSDRASNDKILQSANKLGSSQKVGQEKDVSLGGKMVATVEKVGGQASEEGEPARSASQERIRNKLIALAEQAGSLTARSSRSKSPRERSTKERGGEGGQKSASSKHRSSTEQCMDAAAGSKPHRKSPSRHDDKHSRGDKRRSETTTKRHSQDSREREDHHHKRAHRSPDGGGHSSKHRHHRKERQGRKRSGSRERSGRRHKGGAATSRDSPSYRHHSGGGGSTRDKHRSSRDGQFRKRSVSPHTSRGGSGGGSGKPMNFKEQLKAQLFKSSATATAAAVAAASAAAAAVTAAVAPGCSAVNATQGVGVQQQDRPFDPSNLMRANEKKSHLPLNTPVNPLMAGGSAGEKVTPQQALIQTMAAMHQKAQEMTGVAVPSYYNPAAVNPLKYAEQIKKRKLLWSKAGKEKDGEKEKEENKVQWTTSSFSCDQDGKTAAKFRKLMGIKEEDQALLADNVDISKLTEEQRARQEELFAQLDRDYAFARMTTHTHRGIGLGFSSQGMPDV